MSPWQWMALSQSLLMVVIVWLTLRVGRLEKERGDDVQPDVPEPTRPDPAISEKGKR